MATKIQATLFEDAEAFLRGEVSGFISTLSMDNVTSFRYRSGNLKTMTFDLEDIEEGTKKTLDMGDLVKALQLLTDQIGVKVFVGGQGFGPRDLQDPGNWDVEVVDAFFQLAYHGEVIYG